MTQINTPGARRASFILAVVGGDETLIQGEDDTETALRWPTPIPVAFRFPFPFMPPAAEPKSGAAV